MSDVMLLGILRMPLPDDPSEMGIIEWVQFRGAAREAADEIERRTVERDQYRQELDGVLKMIGDSPKELRNA